MAPPPMPSAALLSPQIKSNTQVGWSQFKEEHPDDFVQETERKRLRDAQMLNVVDTDLRQQQPANQPRLLPLPHSNPQPSVCIYI